MLKRVANSISFTGLLLILLLTISSFSPYTVNAQEHSAPSAHDLTDIEGHWAAEEISKLVDVGVVTGYPDQTFRPDGHITRAEFVTLLLKALEVSVNGEEALNDHWGKYYVSTAYKIGILKGYGDQNLGLDDPITREQMVVMSVRALGLKKSIETKPYVDSGQISAGAREEVQIATEHGLIEGFPDNSFKPKAKTTRAQAAAFINRVMTY